MRDLHLDINQEGLGQVGGAVILYVIKKALWEELCVSSIAVWLQQPLPLTSSPLCKVLLCLWAEYPPDLPWLHLQDYTALGVSPFKAL